jgi:hypothetical protein
MAMIQFLQATSSGMTTTRMQLALDAATRLLLGGAAASSVEVAVLTIRHGVLQVRSHATTNTYKNIVSCTTWSLSIFSHKLLRLKKIVLN